MTDSRIYDLAISFLDGIGDINAKKLISYFSSTKAIFDAKIKELSSVAGIGEITAKTLYASFDKALQLAQEELEYIYTNEIDFVCFGDKNYPFRLKECDDAPMVLYYKGLSDFNAQKIISIVGTRKATNYGIDFVETLISSIASKYPEAVIVSGLAYGIDVAAHKFALNCDLRTWAVLGHSLEFIYPASHKSVAKKILEQDGCILSDYPHGRKIDPAHFAKRNRIVAGLCDALIVVESGERGGSMITANIANHYNRDVFALPGRINSSYSKGCNKLIKTNRANLIESIEDLEYIMNWSDGKPSSLQQKLDLISDLNENEAKVVNILKKYEYLDIDNLLRQTNMDNNILSLCLLELEFKNIVRALPGKLFSLKIK